MLSQNVLALDSLRIPTSKTVKPKFTAFERVNLFIAAALSCQLEFHHTCTGSFLYTIDFWPKRKVNPEIPIITNSKNCNVTLRPNLMYC